jgi:flavin reductase (DIM6/NTAB) family NADH-FMN oxidoreductase RutF
MEKQHIDPRDLNLQPFTTFDPEGVLLDSGRNVTDANLMTISWGMFGIMWGKPVMMVMVRPTRHTWQFITQAPDFTVNWMDETWTDAVRLCGSSSGRDMNKFAAAGLTPVPGRSVQSPIIEESALALECRLLYRHDLQPDQFVDLAIEQMYPAKDYHGLFFGEIVTAQGVDAFRRR